MDSIEVKIDEKILQIGLTETYNILKNANLKVHPYVKMILLTGSRGKLNSWREDSDIDLSLIVDMQMLNCEINREAVLKEILEITVNNWNSHIKLDTAVVFDINNCGLNCLKPEEYPICTDKGIDCIGLYKVQNGISGYVPKIGVDVKKIHPVTVVWSDHKQEFDFKD